MKRKLSVLAGMLALLIAAACSSNNFIKPVMAQKFNAHAVFGSKMVLQQNKPIVFSGKAEPGKAVAVKFNKKTVYAKADDSGEWSAEFKPVKAGGPYTVEISGDPKAKKIVFIDVLVGEVWICSGQSNMEMRVRSVNKAAEEIKNANYPNIRIYQGKKVTSPFGPKNEAAGSGWQVCSPKTIPDFSAAGYFFGRQLWKDLKVPIGLVNISWGGTQIQPWISPEAFRKNQRQEYWKISMAQKVSSKKNAFEELRKEENKASEAWFKTFESEHKSSIIHGELPNLNDSKWLSTSDLTLSGGDIGSVWFRKSIIIPDDWAGKDLLLQLGVIDDADETYFNGRRIGATLRDKHNYWAVFRQYTIPGGQVRPGKNEIAIRIYNYYMTGGLLSDSEKLMLYVKNNPKKMIRLTPPWKKITEFQMNVKKYGVRPSFSTNGINTCQFPSTLYNGMTVPWTKYAIRGVIWYQGCSNAGDSDYYNLHKILIQDWRTAWNDPEMPFIVTQLAGFLSHRPHNRLPETYWKRLQPNAPPYALTREIQAEMLRIPNVGLAVTMDIGDQFDIHPKNKQMVGYRLACEAERICYGRTGVTRGPEFASMKIEGKTIRVSFNNVGLGLSTNDGKLPGAFAIAGADKRFVWAKAYIKGDDVIVYADGIPEPKYVRYAYCQYRGDCNLCNNEGFPALPFRCDKPEYE